MGVDGRSPRVGIEALAWRDQTGYGRFCREIAGALLRSSLHLSFTLLLDAQTEAPEGCEVIRVRNRIDLAWTMSRAYADLWFFPSPLYFVPVYARAPRVVAIHDTIPARYPRLIFPRWTDRLAWRIKMRLALMEASHVVTVSNHARDSLAGLYGLPHGVITAIYGAPTVAFRPVRDPAALAAISRRLGISEQGPMIFYHGALAPHKNLRTLAGAFLRLRREHRDVYLVFAGAHGGAEDHALREMCREVDRVKFPGVLDDADLAAALSRATVAVLPSLDEGFGLTAIEATACGAPLVCTRSSGIPEILGDAALYFDPRDEEALCDHLKLLLGDARRARAMSERARTRAETLSWDDSARRLAGVFENLLGHAPSRAEFPVEAR